MKRLLTTLTTGILAIMMVFLLGCSGEVNANYDEEILKEKAKKYVEDMVAGNFETIEADFTNTLKSQLTATGLAEAYQAIAKDMGAFKSVENIDIVFKNGKAIVSEKSVYDLNGIKTSFTFDDKYKIDGIWLDFATLQEDLVENDKFKEVGVQIGEGDKKLSGILTLPKGVVKPSVAILVHGSGVHDKNETIGSAGNKPFRDIAFGLANNGVATLRYDKRYSVYPEQAQELGDKITVEGEILKDVSYAVDMLAKNNEIDTTSIFILGHSQGGMLAPKIAKDNPVVSGIVSLAGSPRGLEDLVLQQNVNAINSNKGKLESQKPALIQEVKDEVEKIKNLKDGDKGILFGLPASYWISLKDTVGADVAPSLTIPMLFLQGDADFQVFVKEDYEAWKSVLVNKQNATFKLYEKLNHLFMPTLGLTDATEYDPKNSVSEVVTKDISDWIKNN